MIYDIYMFLSALHHPRLCLIKAKVCMNKPFDLCFWFVQYSVSSVTKYNLIIGYYSVMWHISSRVLDSDISFLTFRCPSCRGVIDMKAIQEQPTGGSGDLMVTVLNLGCC